MTRSCLSLLITICCMAESFSQNCNPETVTKLPGTWKAGMKTSSAGYADAAAIAKAKINMETFHKLIQSNFSPAGLQARYAYSRIDKLNALKLYGYSYNLRLHPFYCEKNAVIPEFHYHGKLTMQVNPGLFFEGGGLDFMAVQDHLKYGWVDRMPVEKDGIWDFGEKDDMDGNATIITDYKSHQWLITYNGKLPFQFVSQLEFLQKKKAGIQREKQKAIEETKQRIPIRPKAEQEKEKEEQLKKIKEKAAKGLDTDWTNTFLRNYRSDEQLQEEAIQKTSEYYDKQLRSIDAHFKLPAEELQQRAVLVFFQDFQGFAKEGDIGARILVKENPDYYNNKLSNNAVQLIWIYIDYDSKFPALTNAYPNLTKTIDFKILKNMIGK